jgi:hypothetical protein
MAIKGVSRQPVPYVPEEDRMSPFKEQTVFWIKPKTGHEANQTMARYAAAGRDGRKGYRDLNVSKLDNADVEEFLAICDKVENFIFAGKAKMETVQDKAGLVQVVNELSSDVLIEIMDASNNLSTLEAGAKKDSSSSSTSVSGDQKTE